MTGWIEIRRIPQRQGVTRREAEGAAWRAIVHERLGQNITISYNKNGAPVLSAPAEATYPGFIGVSHTRGWVAVVWSPEPCAVDIELKSRTLAPEVARRYSIESIEDWCTLEALYKYKSLTGTDADKAEVKLLPHPELVVATVRI